MDYDKQSAFLLRQRRRWLPAAAGCGLLLVEVARSAEPLWVRLIAAALALGLLWSASYLPNYLCLVANARRRLRWLARARWFLLALAALFFLASGAWVPLVLVPIAALLHLGLRRRLQLALPIDPQAAAAQRAALLAIVYAVVDATLLGAAHHSGVPGLLIGELLLAFTFFAGALIRLRTLPAQTVWALGVAALSYLPFPSPLAAAGVFLWTLSTARLSSAADRQNLENYEALLEELHAFNAQPRETIVQLLQESTGRLAADWNRSRPAGAAEVTAWYSRNAHYYLYDIAQHHLLYKHITYTLALVGLARRGGLARGRVLDFGGGNGDFSCALARAGLDATYLDVPGESADFVRWRAGRETLRLQIVHDAADLIGPFDLIFALDVLEHLVDIKPTLARWQELLRPGGWLVFTYYVGPASSAPMHIDPGFDVPAYLRQEGFRNIKSRHVGLFSPEYMRKKQFLILEKPATD